MTWLWSSTVVRTETMKDNKMVLIAHDLLESSIGAYIEWLVNKLMTTANKIEYKDSRLVMLPVIRQPTSQIALHILKVFYFSPVG